MKSRRRIVFAVGAGAFIPLTALPQQRSKPRRIGMLLLASQKFHVDTGNDKLFLQGMHELGYVPGRDFVMEERFADGEVARLPALVADLVRTGVDVIVTSGTQMTRAAHLGTSTVPIVVLLEADPVGSGYAVSLARPGRNLTGFSTLFAETIVKNLGLLIQTMPKLARVALLSNPTNPAHKAQIAALTAAAGKTGIKLISLEAATPDDITQAVATMVNEKVQAFIILPDGVFALHFRHIAQLAQKHHLASAYSRRQFPEAGGLMSYGQDTTENWRLGAKFIDRIFKGAKPGDLPFEQPTTFEFVINMKTAQALGIKVPQVVLLQATKVIE